VIRVIRHPGPGSNHPLGSVLAMGNFDGLHRGHAALLSQVRDRARAEGRPAAVLTFEPHPRSVFLPGAEPFRLTPFRVKERELARLGIDLLFIQHFDLGFAAKSAEDFVAEIVVGAIGASHVVIGWDCTFGNRRRGTPDLLRAEGARHGFGVTVLEPVRDEAATVYSSTHIRELLKAGKPREAVSQLATGAGGRSAFRLPIWASTTIYSQPLAFMPYALAATVPTIRSADIPSTGWRIWGCGRRSAAWCRGSRPISSIRTSISMAAISGWRWSISSGQSANLPGSTR